MLVRTLKAHSNGYGSAYLKAVGDEYEHPSPNLLITRGKVEAIDDDRQDKRVQRARKGAGRATAKGDGAKRAAKSGKGRARADGGRRGKKGA